MQKKKTDFNYDESRVPHYTLPNVLADERGVVAESPKAWDAKVRPWLLQTFTSTVYGKPLADNHNFSVEICSEDNRACKGLAIRREIRLKFDGHPDHPLDILLYLPRQANAPVPVFAGLNFWGNHTVDPDPMIQLSQRWMRNNEAIGITANCATEATRGIQTRRWPVELIISRGYALATAYYGDLVPDHSGGLAEGLIGSLRGYRGERAPDEGGAISGWAWGLHRMLDYLQTETAIDSGRMALIGHSRLGKTALWAGAQDTRAALVVSNNSGCSGAALSRRCFGETVGRINTNFPHWFCLNYRNYNEREHALPIDQHQLLALLAPRALYVASATEDLWADPHGEFLALKNTQPVYTLFGQPGLGVESQPSPGHSVGNRLGYHIREGKHDILSADWQFYLDFADRNFSSKV